MDSDKKEKGETQNETSSFTFIPIAYCLLGINILRTGSVRPKSVQTGSVRTGSVRTDSLIGNINQCMRRE